MNARREIRLVNFVEENTGRPFIWGQCDCNVFVLEAMDAIFSTALAEKIRGKYKTEKGAIRYRRRSEWGNLITLLKEAGFAEAQKGFEQTGDILIVAADEWEMAHICLGNRAVAAFPEAGVQTFSMAMMKDKKYRVWRYACLPQ